MADIPGYGRVCSTRTYFVWWFLISFICTLCVCFVIHLRELGDWAISMWAVVLGMLTLWAGVERGRWDAFKQAVEKNERNRKLY